MATKLTSAAVDRIGPRKERFEVLDGGCPGLYLVVQPSGVKSWAVRYRMRGRSVKNTIGRASDWKLDEARDEARSILKAARRGEDPRAAGRTVDEAFEEWMRRDQEGNRSAGEVRRVFEKKVLTSRRWAGRPLAEITRRDCRELIETVADEGAPTTARRLHAHLHRMFRWSVGVDMIETSPMADLPKLGKDVRRDRVLTDVELGKIWRACDKIGPPFGPAVRLLVLTAARRDEIMALRWDEVDQAGGAIRLEGERTKNGVAHSIPLSDQAAAILAATPRLTFGKKRRESEFVFTTTGLTPASGVSRAKSRVDKASGVAGWRLHDLRRTVATGLQRLGHRLEVIEAVLRHVGGSRAGIVGTYQRHAFDDEKRKALQDWADHVEKIEASRVRIASPRPSRSAPTTGR